MAINLNTASLFTEHNYTGFSDRSLLCRLLGVSEYVIHSLRVATLRDPCSVLVNREISDTIRRKGITGLLIVLRDSQGRTFAGSFNLRSI